MALLGENGAGKSTLIKILAGVFRLDSGAVFYRGNEVTGNLRDLPIAFIHQDLGLIEWMTVAENICLTLGYPKRNGTIDWSAARVRAVKALGELDVTIDPEVRVQSLSRTEKSLVAIARALASDKEILVLDEPTASLPADEVARLFVVLRKLRALGIGILYVSHRLDEVFEIADRMVVLRDGVIVGERKISETTTQKAILLIVGKEPSQVFRRPVRRKGEPRLILNEVISGDVGPISLTVNTGEVVGLVGLRGAGHESVGRALFGLSPLEAGTILLDSSRISPQSPREAMKLGINLICADRVGESVVPRLTIRENFFLDPTAANQRWYSYLWPRAEKKESLLLGDKVHLNPNDPGLAIELLSGGNQQKVIIGRWLHLGAKLYIFEDPTAGVDVGAKAEIYRLLEAALEEGAAILIVSTDFEEISKICHRALVFNRGSVVVELDSGDLSVKNLLSAASANIRQAGTVTQTQESNDAIN